MFWYQMPQHTFRGVGGFIIMADYYVMKPFFQFYIFIIKAYNNILVLTINKQTNNLSQWQQ